MNVRSCAGAGAVPLGAGSCSIPSHSPYMLTVIVRYSAFEESLASRLGVTVRSLSDLFPCDVERTIDKLDPFFVGLVRGRRSWYCFPPLSPQWSAWSSIGVLEPSLG